MTTGTTAATSRPGAAAPAAAAPDRRRVGRGRRSQAGAHQWDATPLTRLTLIVAVALSFFPLWWMIVIASRTNADATRFPPPILPGGNLLNNLRTALSDPSSHLVTGLVNSFIVASTVTFGVVVISTMAGFAFAKLRFRGRSALLVVVLLTMAVPLQHIGIVPLYIMMVQLGWTNTLHAVILPFLVNGFGIFLMRQYTLQAVPDSLVEAARTDGANTARIYWSIVLPALRPGMAVLALLTFMLNWNEFLWPLLVLDADNPTVQVAIRQLQQSNYSADFAMLFTGTLISILPLVVIFVAFGKQIIGGIMEGAVRQ
ncbi:MAG TPA: carbohydrate ABC transporter permease [Natronosporangium sp.]